MRRFLLAGTALLLGLSLAAPAHAAPLTPRELDRVPLHALAAASVQRVRAALPAEDSTGPRRLALRVPISLDLDDGVWSEDGDMSVWRARLYSAGATALIPAFDRLVLPAGASLTVSMLDGALVQGPYTSADVNAEGGLWTAMIPGEDALLELRVPTAARSAVDLHLSSLAHGVLAMGRDGVPTKSGSCNIDVACPQGDGFRNQIRATVLLQIPTSLVSNLVTVCSGVLVNNSAQDESPYVLTAHHCGVTTGNAGNVVVYFNYQTSPCGGTPNGSLEQNLSGARRLFTHAQSDHTLIQLNRSPSAAFNVYYGGFDATQNRVPTSGRAIHHPSGDEKRLSVFQSPASIESIVLNNATVNSYGVFWSQGVTEQGSSGGGLWNESQRLVGLLSGGFSSCSNPGGEDYFGRLAVAWDAGLSAQLDPSGVTDRTFCGTNPGQRCSASSGSGTSTTPTTNTDSGTSGNGFSEDSGGSSGGGAFGGAALLMLAAGFARLSRRAGRAAAAG